MTLAPFHPFSMEYTADPRPYFEKFHADRRLLEHEETGTWVAHDYETVRSFCDHPKLSRRPRQLAGFEEGAAERLERWPITEAGMLGGGTEAQDAEDQLILRKLLASDFRPGAIRKMATTVHDVVAQYCAPLQTESDLDVVSLVQSVPLAVISRLLGLSESGTNAEIFLTSAPDFFRGLSVLAADETRDRAELAAKEMFQILAEEVADRHAHPRDDMISQVIEIAAQTDGIEPVQVISSLVVLVAAGTDTTRLSSSLAVKTLLSHPEELEKLRANRELLPNAIMELLRYESPTKFLVRSAHEEFEWQGQTIPDGAMLLLSIFGAGWDPMVFENPDRFEMTRDLKGSLSFGFGAGYCLGVHLARMQIGEIVSYFLDHMPPGASFDSQAITWEPTNLPLREITSMPIQVR
jgi:cytochrome P450